MVRPAQIGSPGLLVGLGACIFLAGCGGTQSITSDSLAVTSDTQVADVVEESNPVDTPAGPQSGDIEATIKTVEDELGALDSLGPTTQLTKSDIVIDFHSSPEDYRSVDGTILEVESTSDDGHYVIGRIDDTLAARISLTCAEGQPGDLLITDLAGRPYSEEWVPVIDRLVPSFVAASGCESSLLGAPTDCLDLPDDPAACIPGDGVEE